MIYLGRSFWVDSGTNDPRSLRSVTVQTFYIKASLVLILPRMRRQHTIALMCLYVVLLHWAYYMPTQNGASIVLSWHGFGTASGFDVERLSLREWESVDSAGGPSQPRSPEGRKDQLLPVEGTCRLPLVRRQLCGKDDSNSLICKSVRYECLGDFS